MRNTLSTPSVSNRLMDIVGLMEGYGPVQQALIAGLFTWFMTAAGAAPVIVFHELDR